MTFEALQIDQKILKAIKDEGYISPTPIQEQAIPIVLKGADLLGCAQTGTGKTAAFAIPILQLLGKREDHRKDRPIRSLIVTPTRELAVSRDDDCWKCPLRLSACRTAQSERLARV